MTAVERFIRQHADQLFFLLAFAVSWSGVLVAAASGEFPATAEQFQKLFPMVYAAMLAGPCGAGILLTFIVNGTSGFRALLNRLFTWHVSAGWYAVALLTAPVVMTTVLLALSLTSSAFMPGIVVSKERVSLLLFGAGVGLGAGFFEELGWTGFATPRLIRRYGVIAAGLLIGVLWGAWHILVNVWAGFQASDGITPRIHLFAVLVSLLAGVLPAYRILMTWVYEQTGSLLVVMLMHASLTACTLVLGPAAAGARLIVYDFTLAAAFWLVVAGVASRASRQVVGT